MPAGRAAAFGAAATVVGAYALQDHLRSRAARREEEDQKRAIMEMLEREAEEGPMGLRGTEEGYAFKKLEDAQQAELLCVALEKLFFRLKKAAPPSSAVTALPFLEIGEAAPATVVLACVLALGDDELAWRLFGDDDEKEPRSAAEGKLRAALAASRSVGISASWLSDSPGGKQAVVEFCRGLAAAPLAPKSDVTFDASRLWFENDWKPEDSAIVTLYQVVSQWVWRRGAPGVRGSQGNDVGLALSLGQSLGVGVCRQSALKETGGNVIVNSVYAEYTGESYQPHTFQINYRKASNGGPRDALWLSCAFAPGDGFSVPVHRSSIRREGRAVTYMKSMHEATGKQPLNQQPPAQVVKARAHFLAALKTAAVGDAWAKALEREAGAWSLEHVAARRGDLMHIESRRDEEVTLEFLRGADEALLNVDPQTVRRAIAAALVRVVPDLDGTTREEGPGPDVAEEVDAFATEYAELILIGLSKVPRLADGRTPVEVVPDESVEDKADRETLGFTHNGSYAARTRHVLVKRERDRRRGARELAVAYVPLAFRLAFAVVVLIGFAGFAWGTATNFVVFLPDTMALAVSVALNLWALYSTLNYTAAFLEVDADASTWRRAAVVTCRFHESLARLMSWELPLVARTRALQASCGDVVLRWSRRLQRQAFREHLSRGRIRASDACLLLEDVARCRARRPARAEHGVEDPLYQYAGEKGAATRGVIPGTRDEAEAFLGLAVEEEHSGAAPLPLPSAALVASLCGVASGRFAGLLENGPASPEDTTTHVQEEPEEPQEPPSPVRPAPLPKKRTIEEALEAGGWEFKRGKHHIVFERHVVAPGGRRAKQTFVAASTPSGRGRKQELARLNKLNREGPAAPADAGGVQRTARRRKKLGKRGR